MLHLKLSADGGRKLQALDHNMTLPGIVRSLIGDTAADHPGDQARPVCGNMHLDVTPETLERLERLETEADQDLDWHLPDMVRVRYLDLPSWLQQKAVALRVAPMVISGRSSSRRCRR